MNARKIRSARPARATATRNHIKRGAQTDERNLSAQVYERVKADIFDFALMPGDRFTEGEIAEKMAVSRTPVREALYRLERDGFIDVLFRSGWRVKPFDFRFFEELYDVRVVLELAAVKRLCEMPEQPALDALKAVWLVPAAEREQDGKTVAALDERFHESLVELTGNLQMARMHHDVTERIRIIRRLDFTVADRVDATYAEHAKILRAILQRKTEAAQLLLKSHIEASKAEVRKITLHRLTTARGVA
jgi:DNA-binding GntR family transcriptional regulator